MCVAENTKNETTQKAQVFYELDYILKSLEKLHIRHFTSCMKLERWIALRVD